MHVFDGPLGYCGSGRYGPLLIPKPAFGGIPAMI